MPQIDLYNGDCLDVMQQLINRGIKVDAIITDLPYGTTACKWDTVIPFDKMWECLKGIRKNGAVIALFGSEPFSSLLRCSNLEEFKYDWVWEKNNASNFQLVKKHPLKIHETVSIFYNLPKEQCMIFANIMKYHMKRLNLSIKDIQKLQPSKNGKMTGWVSNKLNGIQLPTKEQWSKICNLFDINDNYEELLQKVDNITYNVETTPCNISISNKNKGGNLNHISVKTDTYTQYATNYPKSILKYNREVGLHPTQKPVALLEYLVKTYTNEGDTVLDFTMGSGTTGVACKSLNRNFIGIEKNENYFKIAEDRINGI